MAPADPLFDLNVPLEAPGLRSPSPATPTPQPGRPVPEAAAVTLRLRPWIAPDNNLFNCGTCQVALATLPTAYGVVAVKNSRPGNGDFAALLAQLLELAKQNGRDLLVLEIHNPR